MRSILNSDFPDIVFYDNLLMISYRVNTKWNLYLIERFIKNYFTVNKEIGSLLI